VRKIGGLLRKNPKKKDEQNMAELIGDAQMDVSSGDDGQDNVNTGEGSSYYSASDEPTQPIADGAAESLVVAPQEKSRPSGFRAFFQCKSKPTEADVDARIAELNGRLRDLETELCSGLCVGTATSIDIQLYHITTVIRSELEGFAPDRVTGELLSKLEEFSSDPRDRKSIEAVDRALYLAKHPHTFFVRRTVGLMGLLRSCSGTSDNAIVEALLPKAIYVKQIDEALDRIRKQSSKEDIRYMRISRAKQALAALIDEALRITNGDHPKGKLGEFASSVTSVSQSLRNTMELLPEVTDANTANDFYERIFDICEDATDSFDEFGFRKIDFTEFKLAAE
ncbi:MAG: hypothetical protein LBB38_03825, partial [Puniceicoccales bacterium]|nr:hypothetical protein [Puniceicoccales bacterium]